ncbi:MAG: hypothetical protein DRJ03_03340 [Chloroflexi bacterium]|nr:MAG: hypothetical protein DRJ03_03340 [Chloroflexota bacterium]
MKNNPYIITLCKTAKECNNRKFQKIDGRPAPMPWLVQNQIFAYSKFSDLFTAYKKLSVNNEAVCQLSGTLADENLTIPRPPFRRQARQYTFDSRAYALMDHGSVTPDMEQSSIVIPQPDIDNIQQSLVIDPATYAQGYNYIMLDFDKVVEPHLTTDYITAYTNNTLDIGHVKSQAAHLLKETFPKADIDNIPYILRLSSRFGTADIPEFRAHIIVPTTPYHPKDIVGYLSRLHPFLDPSLYKAPNNFLITSNPEFSKTIDPMINRFFFLAASDRVSASSNIQTATGSIDITQAIAGAGGLPLPKNGRATKTRPHLKTTDLGGEPGVFNRFAAKRAQNYGVNKWLIDQGYIFKSKTAEESRYISPESDSKTAGCIYYNSGFVVDHHSKSPISTLFPGRKCLSPHDLWQETFTRLGKGLEFQELVIKAQIEDDGSKKELQKTIEQSIDFLSLEESEDDMVQMVESLIDEIFYSRLDPTARESLFARIKERTSVSNSRPFLMRDIRGLWDQKIKDITQNVGTFDPKNDDTANADIIIKTQNVACIEGDRFVFRDEVGILIPVRGGQDVKDTIYALILKSYPAAGMSYAKMTSICKATYTALLKNPSLSSWCTVLTHKSRFEYTKICIDTKTGALREIGSNEFIATTLPFSLAAWESDQTENAEFWKYFLKSSLPKKRDRELIKDLFRYLISGPMEDQVIVIFHGVPRSGKSHIKKLLSILSGRSNTLEMDPSAAGDTFVLSGFLDTTKLLVLNEFNSDSGAEKATFKKWYTILKCLSGRDALPIRRMNVDRGEEFISPALPLIIANNVPRMLDEGLNQRIVDVEFTERHNDNPDHLGFERSMRSVVPYVFRWALEHNQTAKISPSLIKYRRKINPDTLEEMPGGSTLLKNSNPFAFFCKKYIQKKAHPTEGSCNNAPSNRINKDDIQKFYRFFCEVAEISFPRTPHFPTVKIVREIFSDHRIERHRSNSTERAKGYGQWVFTNLKWKNVDALKAEYAEALAEELI